MSAERQLDVWGEETPATETAVREASGEEILAAAVLRLAFEDLEKHRHATEVRRRRAFRRPGPSGGRIAGLDRGPPVARFGAQGRLTGAAGTASPGSSSGAIERLAPGSDER